MRSPQDFSSSFSGKLIQHDLLFTSQLKNGHIQANGVCLLGTTNAMAILDATKDKKGLKNDLFHILKYNLRGQI